MIFYLNRKGNKVYVIIKRHAVFALQKRYNKLFNANLSLVDTEKLIKSRFPLASRVYNLSAKERARVKRHGHTLYFRDSKFTFVVHNAVIITVEISKKGFRYLN
jgi:hypothetical protein